MKNKLKNTNAFSKAYWNVIYVILGVLALLQVNAKAETSAIDIAKKTAEMQIRKLVDPILEKYCRDDCKLLGVSVNVDRKVADTLSPGFDEVEPSTVTSLAPSDGKVKLLINEKVGPVTRGKLLDLIQQYLDNLDYTVEIDTQLTRFPEPVESASKIVELKERISKQFRQSLEELFQQFCPHQCLLSDYSLSIEAVNTEEAQYGQAGEFVQDGSVSVRIKDISGTILIDELLSPDEQTNILTMAQHKTSQFKHVNLTSKATKFPHPVPGVNGYAAGYNGVYPYGVGAEGIKDGKTAKDLQDLKDSKELKDSKQNSSLTDDRKLNQLTQQQTENQLKTDTNNTEKTDSVLKNSEDTKRNERFEHYEKIERVENGDAVQKELEVFKKFGLIFGCSILAFLVFLSVAAFRRTQQNSTLKIDRELIRSADTNSAETSDEDGKNLGDGNTATEGQTKISSMSELALRLKNSRLMDDLTSTFAQNPKVAKVVFSRILSEEGLETTAQYMNIFGESIVIDMLRDPSLHADINNLIEFFSKSSMELDETTRHELLKKLYQRTVAGKLYVIGNRTSSQFDFLSDLDAQQIWNLVENDTLTIQALTLTQTEPKKRSELYNMLSEDTRVKVLSELSRIDHLPKSFITQTAEHLRHKIKSDPKLNTEALPGSDILVDLLEKAPPHIQRNLLRNLKGGNPETLHVIKKRLLSVDTLAHLPENQMLDVLLSLPNDELVKFLKACPDEIRDTVFRRAPEELSMDLQEQLTVAQNPSREAYQAIEKRILNKMKLMVNEGLIDLVDINEQLFSLQTPPTHVPPLRKVG